MYDITAYDLQNTLLKISILTWTQRSVQFDDDNASTASTQNSCGRA